jgi:hypothetical protein
MTTENRFQRLKKLFPDAPLLVGDVVQATSYGATVELPSGALITVRGTATVGQRVFVRDGLIEGVAPALPFFEIEI